MAFYCEIYGYLSYRGEPPKIDALVGEIASDSRLRITFSQPGDSFTLGYLSFAGEARVGVGELEGWFGPLEAFMRSNPFVVCTCHIVPEDEEALMYCYFKGEMVFKNVRTSAGVLVEDTAL